jgi:cytochrome c
MMPKMMSQGVMMPSMDPAKGRKLFAAKGCVVCHAVNGIGGKDAAALDASTMPGMTNPFDFVANMWRGASAMIDMQREELGAQIEFTGQDLADIIAFLHYEKEQKKFSDADIPQKIKAVMTRVEEPEGSQHMKGMEMNKPKGQPGSGN